VALFIQVEVEPVVQINDQTRIDCTKTFRTPDQAEITLVRIRPTAGGSFIEVTDTEYLDWAYDADGDHVVTIEYTAGAVFTRSVTISVVDEEEDHLFSNDSDLKVHEPDILKYVREGRSSYLDYHRRTQTLILDHLDREGYVDIHGNKYTKDAVVDFTEVKEWSTFMTLRLIFEGISNSVDDIFSAKSKRYKGLENEHRDRVILRIDQDGDEELNTGEEIDGMRTARVFRR
jgi:hypothetical protein